MPYAFPATGAIDLATIRDAYGDTNPVSLSEFYDGSEYVIPGQGFPTVSGTTISMDVFYGKEARFRLLSYFTASGSFTVPSNINRIFIVMTGGGGGGGTNITSTNADGTVSTLATGGAGGFGGLVMASQDVTPGAIITATVGAAGARAGAGGTSTFNGLTAAGGSAGGNATSTPATSDKAATYTNGTVGANGTSSGTNYVGTAIIGTNTTSTSWPTTYDALIAKYVGTVNATNRTNITVVRNQTATRDTVATWNSAGTLRPGAGGNSNVAGGAGAILVYY